MLLFISIFMLGASTAAAEAAEPPVVKPATMIVVNDFAKNFANFAVEGSVVVYDHKNDVYIGYNPQRCAERFIPASTFKIVNALIGLESEVILDENYVIEWNGQPSGVSPHWDRDNTLASGFKYSVVWYYQELARRVGPATMQHYIDLLGYGNRNIGGGIDQFWLRGEIRISQLEQIELLKRLYKNELPLSQRNMEIVKTIMIQDKRDAYTLRGKTGWAVTATQNVGWYVGYVEKGGNVYFFATNIVSPLGHKDFLRARTEITLDVLKYLKII